jgi:transglutaminase-like putative cysteine protease
MPETSGDARIFSESGGGSGLMTRRRPETERKRQRIEVPTTSTRQILWLVFAILVAGLPHLFFLHPWIPVVVLGIAAWRLLAATKRWPLPSIWLRIPLTVLGFASVLASYRQISGLDAGSALLLVMAAMKLLETRGHRDRAVMVFICYFLLFAAFLREQAIWSAGYLIAGVIVTTATLYQTSRSGTVVNASLALKMSVRLVVQAVPLMLLLFLLFPRIPGPFWALPQGSGQGMTGLTNTLTPGDITALARSDKVAFRVRFAGTPPPQSELYWRGPVMTHFDGRTWTPKIYSVRPMTVKQGDKPGREFDYQVTLEPHGQHWLLAMETPVTWNAPQADLSAAYQLVNRRPVDQLMTYRGRSSPGGSIPGNNDPISLRDSSALPPSGNLKTIEFARELRSRTAGDRAFLDEILEYFRRQPFYYTLKPPPLGANSVDEFLFETRKGFCGHYASAFAVLARAAGIPARVVAGYQGAERNPLGNYWIVRQSDAHAWTEVWLDERWVRIDPTAAVAPERVELGFDEAIDWTVESNRSLMRRNPFVARMALTWDAANAGWNQWVLSFGPEAQTSILSAMGVARPSIRHLIIAMMLTTSLFLVGVSLVQRRYHQPVNDPLGKTYQRLCARAEKVGRKRLPVEGPHEYATALEKIRPDLAGELRTLFEMYIALRYDGRNNDDLMQKFRSAVRQFRPRFRPAPAPL